MRTPPFALPVAAVVALVSSVTSCSDDGEADPGDDGVVVELAFPNSSAVVVTDFEDYVRAERQLTPGPPADLAFSAVRALAAGPSPSEAEAGAYTPIPHPAAVEAVALDGGVLIVDFDVSLNDSAASIGTTTGAAALRSSLALTVFQLPEISEIELRLDGSCEEFARLIGAEECERLQRADWKEFL